MARGKGGELKDSLPRRRGQSLNLPITTISKAKGPLLPPSIQLAETTILAHHRHVTSDITLWPLVRNVVSAALDSMV